MAPQKEKRNGLSASFITGSIALVFLIIGYQVALFVHKAAVTRLVANRDQPDTVYVYYIPEDSLPGEAPDFRRQNREPMPPETRGASPMQASNAAKGDAAGFSDGIGHPLSRRKTGTSQKAIRKNASHSPQALAVREKASPRRVESFPFDPNTASLEDLQRLGFSQKQAESIDHYRQKGGRFRRPADFAKSYVVADSVFDRLEPFIRIPRLDINTADSLALLDLPGIGPYFAGKVVQYRTQLGGYSTVEQLLEIYHFDREKLDGMRDLITCSEPTPYPLWTLPEADLARHPHISRAEAHSIVLYREHHRPEECTLEGLQKAGVLSSQHFAALSLCRLAPLIPIE